jgi:hypothetical protein
MLLTLALLAGGVFLALIGLLWWCATGFPPEGLA